PKELTGGKITADQAGKKALEFIDRRYPPENYVVERVSINKGKIRAYNVDIASRLLSFQEKAAVALSETGGHVLWYTNARNVGKQSLSLEQAREKAKEFLIRRGYRDMLPTYYEHGGGVAIFNFAATQNGVILYPDQIKVTVALDNGQVLGMEAAGYLMNHHRREIPRPRLTAAQARAKLSPHLKNITGGHLAVIPIGTDQEKLVYEFRGQLDNDTFLVYINALDGKEEQVLRLVRNREGILTL
ncbi:MAG: PepSY1/2 domain-containing protein, partial [Bacillota bacterium]